MDLRFTEEHEKFRQQLRVWLKQNLERPWIEEIRDPSHTADSLFEVRRRWQEKLCRAGYLGMDWPVEWGGRGATAVEKAIFAEETIHTPPIASRVGINLLAPALIRHGTEEQRRRFLPRMLSGEEIWCQGFSEPDAGSDLAALRTRAEPDGDHFRIYGQKVWTTFGPWSNWIFVLARTDPNDRYGGISFFLVSMNQPEVEVRPIKQITGESEFSETFFNGALARREHILGNLGDGWNIAMTVLAYERGSMSLAHPARYDAYLGDLVNALRENGMIDRPDVREKIGRLLVEKEVMRANGFQTLATLASGGSPGLEASFEKLFWSEYAQRLADTALELLGLQAHLLVKSRYARPEMDWGHEAVWCRAVTVYAGSSEIQRNIIAKRLLKLPGA
ncbi:MAG: acyl-CoA dehydrogenase family protein [Acidobacteria bacterium]|nr:acyl-CoA dehydrogenase family protein [Acidobacteriota bacterium]